MSENVLYKEKNDQVIANKNIIATHIALEYYPPDSEEWNPH